MNATEPRARYRDALPQLADVPFLTDGGIETTLIFHDGLELPHFAAYDLLTRDGGADALRRYFEPYAEIARAARRRHRPRDGDLAGESGLGRASRPRPGGARGAQPSRRAPARGASAPSTRPRRRRSSSRGCVGPRGDGYVVGEAMTAEEAEAYHARQIGTFAGTAADLVTAITMTYADEAVGVVRAAGAAGLPVVISFTVETDGRLPSGQPLREAIEEVDARTDGAAAYFMVNCAHPSHFDDVLEPGCRVDRPDPRAPRERVAAQPRRARRGGGARRGRPRGARVRLRRAPRAAAGAPRARRLLRHRPPPRRRDVRSVAQRLARKRESAERIRRLIPASGGAHA